MCWQTSGLASLIGVKDGHWCGLLAAIPTTSAVSSEMRSHNITDGVDMLADDGAGIADRGEGWTLVGVLPEMFTDVFFRTVVLCVDRRPGWCRVTL